MEYEGNAEVGGEEEESPDSDITDSGNFIIKRKESDFDHKV